VSFAAPAFNHIRFWSLMEGVTAVKKSIRRAIGSAASLPFIVAGTCLFLGADGGFFCAAAGVIVSLVAGVWNSWILLVEILR
jgi:hypothetical protein